MNTDLDQDLYRDGIDIATAAAWINQQLASSWAACWHEHLPAITALHKRVGEPAYGLYNRELFAPVQARLDAAGLVCRPALPGTLPLSEEDWGPEDHRERRMWTLLHDPNGSPMGAVVTRFFHDHTRLRLPAPPTVVAVSEVDHDRIRQIVLQDPSMWPRSLPGPAAGNARPVTR